MPPPLWQFWTDWTVKALAALATFLAVFVALFGSWLRYVIAPPQLTIAIADTRGYTTELAALKEVRTDNKVSKEQYETKGLWYHVRVENRTRWNPVTELHIFLLSIETPDAAGDFRPVWIGHAALGWRHNANPQGKKIGYAAECDLCHVLKEPLQLWLSPIIPADIPLFYSRECRIRLTLQARGMEADSNLLRVEISWNGKWSDDQVEMMRHLVVRAV
jgi:hypothetical protein